MTLRISLRDGEKMVVNGAVLSATGRASFVIENRAAILRGREIMSPQDATTPARRLYFACMLAYIDAGSLPDHQQRIVTLLCDLVGALEAAEAKASCLRFATHVAMADYYAALGECRALIEYEAEALARIRPQAA